MKRQDFYLELALELNKLKVPPELINTHIEQFKEYLQTLTEEQAEKQIASFGDVKVLAANIYRLLCGSEDVEIPYDTSQSADEDELYNAFRVEGDEADNSDIADIATDYSQVADEFGVPDYTANPDGRADDGSDDAFAEYSSFENENTKKKKKSRNESECPPAPQAPSDGTGDGERLSRDELRRLVKELPEIPQEDKNDNAEEEDDTLAALRGNNSALFYILLIVTLPLTLPLFTVIMACFGFVYLLLGIMNALFFAGIFVSSVGGATLALTGGLYGVSMLTRGVRPIGLFELGLALVIVGITVLLVFIFSLLSMRAVPKLFTYQTRFLRLFLAKLIELVGALKKRCASK